MVSYIFPFITVHFNGLPWENFSTLLYILLSLNQSTTHPLSFIITTKSSWKLILQLISHFFGNRYQKKIATYDKELWEKTVEEKILYSGFGGGVGLKTAKLKTDLIDVDLVRG